MNVIFVHLFKINLLLFIFAHIYDFYKIINMNVSEGSNTVSLEAFRMKPDFSTEPINTHLTTDTDKAVFTQ